MKFRLSLPNNEDFFQRYAGLVPTLSKLGYLAQIVSALTEVGILFALVRNAVADIAPPAVATGAGIIGGLLGTAFIEVGLRKFLPFSFRQVLNKRFSGLDMIMTVAIISATVMLLSASGFLSFKGSKDTVETMTPPAKKGEVVTGLYDDLKNGERIMFSEDSAAIVARYAPQISALNLAHTASAEAGNTKLKAIESKERNTGQIFSSQKATIKQSMADAAAAHALKLAEMQSQQAAELKARQDKRDAEIAIVNGRLSRAFQTEERQFAEAEAKRLQQVKVWGGSVAWFTVLCLAVLILSIGLQEVHHHGAGIQEEALPNEYHFRESAFDAFVGAVSERWNALAFAWIKKFEDGTPEPPEPGKPPTVYEYEAKIERRPIGFTTGKSSEKTTKESSEKTSGVSSVSKETQAEIDELRRRLKAYEEKEKHGLSKERIVAYDFRKETNTKICAHCQQSFIYNHAKQKYCSEDCRKNHWESMNGRKPYMKKGGKP